MDNFQLSSSDFPPLDYCIGWVVCQLTVKSWISLDSLKYKPCWIMVWVLYRLLILFAALWVYVFPSLHRLSTPDLASHTWNAGRGSFKSLRFWRFPIKVAQPEHPKSQNTPLSISACAVLFPLQGSFLQGALQDSGSNCISHRHAGRAFGHWPPNRTKSKGIFSLKSLLNVL